MWKASFLEWEVYFFSLFNILYWDSLLFSPTSETDWVVTQVSGYFGDEKMQLICEWKKSLRWVARFCKEMTRRGKKRQKITQYMCNVWKGEKREVECSEWKEDCHFVCLDSKLGLGGIEWIKY